MVEKVKLEREIELQEQPDQKENLTQSNHIMKDQKRYTWFPTFMKN